jgi:hypothetical protein
MIKKICCIFLFLIICYFTFSTLTYRFKHPEKTETQLILDTLKALRLED